MLTDKNKLHGERLTKENELNKYWTFDLWTLNKDKIFR